VADDISITLLNPHADDFIKTPVSFRLAGRRGLAKYSYMLDEPLRNGQVVNILIDGTLSSLINQSLFNRLPSWMRGLILRIELLVWLRINDLTGKVSIHWSPDSIPDRTTLYLTSYKNCVGAFDKRKAYIELFKFKVINLSHYFILTAEKAANISSLTGVIFTSEADLRQNPYFSKYFSADALFLVLPFTVSSRFHAVKPLETREKSCVATGSFHNLYLERPVYYYRDFIKFFGISTYHPIRKLIYDRQTSLQGQIMCRVFPYRERRSSGRTLSRLMSWLGFDFTQREYFSFDIVELYNNYVFAVVGEEVSGLPPIGFFEAIACGCVVLGEGTAFYEAVGLQPDVHYLIHNGTIEGILATMERVLRDPETLARISAAAQTYVEAHCRSAAVWKKLQGDLRPMIRNGGHESQRIDLD